MQTVEIAEHTVDLLERLKAQQGLSATELVEKALAEYSKQHSEIEEGAPQRSWPELDAVFGIWKDRGEDAFEYLRRIRGE